MESVELFTCAAAFAVLLITTAGAYMRRQPNLDAIPAIGPTGLLSYLVALKSAWNAQGIVQEGYDKYYGTPFKVPMLNKWMVVLTGPQLINDIRQARDEDISALVAVDEIIHMRYTFGPGVLDVPYHIEVLKSAMTKKWAFQFAEVRDEVVQAFNEAIPLRIDDWVSLPCLQTMVEIVCRTSNRLFVGLPLCRNRDYRDLNIDYTMDVVLSSVLIGIFPKAFHPLVGPLLSPLNKAMKRASKHLTPIIEERLRMEDEYGEDWPDRPNDLISWLLQGAQDEQRTPPHLIMRILLVNFAAIHTSANSFTHALYHLAAEPKYAEPMREEVEAVINDEGWTKSALRRMRKVDSFLREAQRVNGFGCLNMNRKVLNPSGFKLSNGTVLPHGTSMAVATYGVHHDKAYYPNPHVFDGFRYAEMREEDGEGIRHQMVTTSVDYVAFGHGRHSCPGRFFASNELKMMLAHVLLTYDVKFQDAGVYPPNEWLGSNSGANRKAKVMFRKRQL